MYLRNLTYPRMMLGTPNNSTVSMIAGNQKGVTITAQEGRQDCFVQMRFNTPRDTSLVFQTDIWNVVGDQSTVRNGYVLIAELDPWNSLCSAASAGRTSLKFTPTRDFIIRPRLPRFGQHQLHAAPAHDGSRLEPDARTRRRLLRRRPHAINQWGGGRAKRHCLAARLRRSDWVVAA